MIFVHAADLHLDSPLAGLPRYDGAPIDELRQATRRALENLVQLCIDENAGFLLLAGDVYDGNWRDYNTGLFFSRHMARLREAGIPVFVIRGNHDAESEITRQLTLPENVAVFPTRAPETKRLEDLGVAIHGQGFAQRWVESDLSANYPPPVPGLLNIGMLHTSLDGRPNHDPYSPCSREGLASRGYDYWALGHVHQREVQRVDDCWIVFPGNVQGRHIREPGEKGCSVVTVEGCRVREVRHHRLDVLEWAVCELDLPPGRGDLVEAFERWAKSRELEGDRLLALRVVVTATAAERGRLERERERHLNNLRAVATDRSQGRIWLEKLEIRCEVSPPQDEALSPADEELVSGLRRFTEEIAADPDGALAAALEPLRRVLPSELLEGADALDLEIASLLPAARDLLLACVRPSVDAEREG